MQLYEIMKWSMEKMCQKAKYLNLEPKKLLVKQFFFLVIALCSKFFASYSAKQSSCVTFVLLFCVFVNKILNVSISAIVKKKSMHEKLPW